MHETVDTEIAVVGIVAEIATIGPIFLPRRALCQQTLVLEVPDEFTGQTRVLLVEVEHVADITHRVTHRVAVLALDVRTVLLATANPFDGFVAAVHGRADISIVAVALVVCQTGLVECLDGIGNIFEVIAITRLIAKRPHENTRVIAHPQHVVLGTLDHRRTEQFHRRQPCVGVTLHVGLGQHVEAVLVAKVVEHRIVGIVARAHGIDVQALHGLDVLFNLSRCDGTAVDGREVVAVHTMKHHALAVDGQRAVAADFHPAETHLAASAVDDITVLVLQRQHQVIEVGCLGAPQFRGVHRQHKTQAGGHRLAALCNDFAIAHQTYVQSASADGIDTGQRHLDVRSRTRIARIEVGVEEIVANLTFRCRPKETRAVNTRQSPVVLTFQERPAGETEHLQGDGILASRQIRGNIEFRRQVRILAVPYPLAVNPQVVSMSHAVEAHIHVAAGPVGRNGERATVGSHRIRHTAVISKPTRTVGHHRISAFVVRKRIGHIAVQGLVPRFAMVQSPHLPARRHVNVGPRRVIIVLATILVLGQRRLFHPQELPLAVKRLIPRRARHVVSRYVSLRNHWNTHGVSLLAVHTRCLGVVPLFARLGIDSQGCRTKTDGQQQSVNS